ncbi:MAG: hypothetical protein F4132_10330 [Gemmatimonadetes bacterium]|nr:hypothetical protein [Gemmatimonadota bacterium]
MELFEWIVIGLLVIIVLLGIGCWKNLLVASIILERINSSVEGTGERVESVRKTTETIDNRLGDLAEFLRGKKVKPGATYQFLLNEISKRLTNILEFHLGRRLDLDELTGGPIKESKE